MSDADFYCEYCGRGHWVAYEINWKNQLPFCNSQCHQDYAKHGAMPTRIKLQNAQRAFYEFDKERYNKSKGGGR